MKVKLLTTISFFTYQFSISQTEKLLQGKVISQTLVLNDIEVINKTTQTSTRTNELGEFSILVNAKDSLIFFSKDYFFKRIKLTQNDLDKNNLLVDMILKPEELDEVVIHKINFPHVTPARESLSTNTSSSLQKYTGFYDGTITNGVNFIAVGQQIYDLFKKDKEKPKKKTLEIDFKKLVATSIPNDFFTKDLKIAPDEVELFIEYCDADPRSKRLLENNNILTTMDFLYAKNIEFQKLKTEPKN